MRIIHIPNKISWWLSHCWQPMVPAVVPTVDGNVPGTGPRVWLGSAEKNQWCLIRGIFTWYYFFELYKLEAPVLQDVFKWRGSCLNNWCCFCGLMLWCGFQLRFHCQTILSFGKILWIKSLVKRVRTDVVCVFYAEPSPYDAQADESKSGGTNTAAIALGVIIPIVLIALILVIAFFVYRRKWRSAYSGCRRSQGTATKPPRVFPDQSQYGSFEIMVG